MSDSTDPNSNPDDTSAENFAALRDGKVAVERELAFTKAGIDTETPQGKVLMQTYEGKLDRVDIQACRDSIFGAPEPDPTPTSEPAADPAAQEPAADPDPHATELQQQQAMRDAFVQGAPGAVDVDPPAPNPYDVAAQAYHQARAGGMPQENAAYGAIDTIIAAAASGEPTVIHDPVAWEQEKAAAGHSPRGTG